ncbi:hypothetical protein PAN31108_05103 [Pandoraea anhela]|uniref:Uncharacterized protein n=1 Tax=Pandoraea anhela TaxID=2508295 RepID=A0A5E4Z5X1_9BURK|nr:hypothetical protein PAN31108_05103 [Pandoraea anhela]
MQRPPAANHPRPLISKEIFDAGAPSAEFPLAGLNSLFRCVLHQIITKTVHSPIMHFFSAKHAFVDPKLCVRLHRHNASPDAAGVRRAKYPDDSQYGDVSLNTPVACSAR